MNMTSVRKRLSLLLCTVLIAAMALFTTACSDNKEIPETSKTSQNSQIGPADQTTLGAQSTSATVLGQGQTVFSFIVTDLEGNETAFEIHTDKTIVGEALQELGLLEGEEGPYGLYVNTVNGITIDWDRDKAYWSFYIDGQYAMSGVDTTEITAGSSYAFKAEKG